MTGPAPEMTTRQRSLRILGGGALVAIGAAVFSVSKRLDPDNRAGILGVIPIVIGLSWIGQGVRGRTDAPVHRESGPPVGAPIPASLGLPALVAAWLIPGLGHWIVKRRAKALLFFFTITITVVAGLLLAHGRNMHWERDRIWFAAYAFNGLETLLASQLTKGLEVDHVIPHLQVGFLYAAVGSILNLVAMMDLRSLTLRSLAWQEREAQAVLDEANAAMAGTPGTLFDPEQATGPTPPTDTDEGATGAPA